MLFTHASSDEIQPSVLILPRSRQKDQEVWAEREENIRSKGCIDKVINVTRCDTVLIVVYKWPGRGDLQCDPLNNAYRRKRKRKREREAGESRGCVLDSMNISLASE